MNTSAYEFALSSIRRLEAGGTKIVIDADTHATDVDRLTGTLRARYDSSTNYYHGRPLSAEDLIREMAMAGVDMALTWQNPAATAYSADADQNAEALLEANRYIHHSACRYPDRFIPGGWIDPKACGLANALAMVETVVLEFGFAIVKMNPAQNQFPIDSTEVLKVVGRIVELGATPAFHYGADSPFTPAEGLRKVAEAHPDHPILAVHMGGGGAGYVEAERQYEQSRQLGLERPNIRYVLSAKRDTHIESDLITYQLAGEPFRRHLFCASDAPYGRMTWNFGGYRKMFESLLDGKHHSDARVRRNPELFTPEAVQGYLGGNFARFAIEAYQRLLARHRTQRPQAANPDLLWATRHADRPKVLQQGWSEPHE